MEDCCCQGGAHIRDDGLGEYRAIRIRKDPRSVKETNRN